VPEVLINGNHANVEKWRRKKQIERTMAKRPDMFEKLKFEDENDKKLLKEVMKDAKRVRLTEPVSYRAATEDDMEDILRIVSDAKAALKRHRVDQWQGEYPNAAAFIPDMERGECFVISHGDEIAAFFTLTTREEECYEHITDGKWTADMPYCTLHRCAVSAKYRGSGMAERMIGCVEAQAREYGLRAIRVDTHKKNKAMQNLLREKGFRYRGNVLVNSEPGHDPARQAFEKILKK